MKTNIFQMILEENIASIEEYISNGGNVNIIAPSSVKDINPFLIEQGDTPLILAIGKKNLQIVDILIKNGANINFTSSDGVSPLQASLYSGLNELAEFLIDNGANIHSMDKHGTNALHKARTPEIIHILITKGVDVNAVQHTHGFTAMHAAVIQHNLKKAKMLMANGANRMAVAKNGETALHIWVSELHDKELFHKMFWSLYEETDDINMTDYNGNTLLHWAIGAVSPLYLTPLPSSHSIEQLLALGANPYVKNKEGVSAQMYVKSHPQSTAVPLFRKYYIPLNIRDKFVFTLQSFRRSNVNNISETRLVEKKESDQTKLFEKAQWCVESCRLVIGVYQPALTKRNPEISEFPDPNLFIVYGVLSLAFCICVRLHHEVIEDQRTLLNLTIEEKLQEYFTFLDTQVLLNDLGLYVREQLTVNDKRQDHTFNIFTVTTDWFYNQLLKPFKDSEESVAISNQAKSDFTNLLMENSIGYWKDSE